MKKKEFVFYLDQVFIPVLILRKAKTIYTAEFYE